MLKPPSITFLDQRAEVEALARVGAAEEDIAAELKISLARLRKRYGRELRRGDAMGKNELLTALYRKANEDTAFNPTWLCVKARCGWRDTGNSEKGPSIIHSILKITTRKSNEDEQNRA